VKALLFALMTLILVGVAAIALAPALIDPADHKAAIANRLEAATGGRVAIDGAVGFETLPRPALTLKSVRLTPAGADGGVEVRVAALRVELRPRPLLRGEVQVGQAVLVAPEATVAAGAGPVADPRVLLARLRAWGVERVRVERGRLTVPSPVGGGPLRLTEIGAELRRGTATPGAFEAEGTLRAGDLATSALGFRLRLGAETNSGERPYSLRLNPVSEAVNGAALPRLSLSGRMAAAGPFRARGTLEARAENAGALPPGPARRLVTWLGAPGTAALSLGGALELSSKRAVLSELDLRLGGVQGRGRAALAFGDAPNLRAELHVPRLDLDSRLAAADGDDQSLSAWMPARLPKRWRGTLDLTLGAVVYRNRVLRELALEADLAGAAVQVARLDALLPGSSALRLSGTARLHKPHTPAFEGRIEARSDNLRTVFDWLGLDLTGVSPERLRRLDGTGRIEARPGRLAVTALDLRLDTMTVEGGVIAALRARPGLGIGLRVDRLDLDAYRAPDADEAGLRQALGRFDANLDLAAETVVYGGHSLRDLRVKGTLDDGRLTLRQARLTGLAGGALSLAGSVAPVTVATPELDLDIDWQAASATGTADLLGFDGGWAEGLGRFDLTGHLAGPPTDLSVELDLRALGGWAQARGQVRRGESGLSVDLDTTLAHDSLRGLLAAATGAPRPAQALGGVNLSARLRGDRGRLTAEGFGGKLGPVQISGLLKGEFEGPRPNIAARLETGALPLPALLARDQAGGAGTGDEAVPDPAGFDGAPWDSAPIDLGMLKAVDAEITLDSAAVTLAPGLRLGDARLDATLEGGRLQVETLSGTFLGGRAEARLALDTTGTPALDLSAETRHLDPAALPARLRGKLDLGGRLDLSLSAQARGGSEAALAESLAGDVRVTGKLRLGMAAGAETGLLRYLLGARAEDLARRREADARLQAAFGEAPAPVSGHVTAKAGVLRSTDLSLRGRGLVATVGGALDLADWRVDGTVAVAQPSGAAPGEVRGRLAVRLAGRLGRPRLRLSGDAADLLAPAADTPKVTAPQVEAPTVETPTVEPPTVEVPEVDSPGVDAPKTPAREGQAPSVGAPELAQPPEVAPPKSAPVAETESGDAGASASGEGEARGGLRSADEIIEDLLRDRPRESETE